MTGRSGRLSGRLAALPLSEPLSDRGKPGQLSSFGTYLSRWDRSEESVRTLPPNLLGCELHRREKQPLKKVFPKRIYLSDGLMWVWEPKNRRNWASQSSEDSSTEQHFNLNQEPGPNVEFLQLHTMTCKCGGSEMGCRVCVVCECVFLCTSRGK